MLNVLGLILNFVGAILLSINIITATSVETVANSGTRTLGRKGMKASLAARSNVRLGFIYTAVGFCFQMLHEVRYIETDWAVVGLLSFDAVLIGAFFYDYGKRR